MRASFPPYNNTKSQIWLRTFYFMSNFLYGLSFSGFARFPEFREARLMTASAVHSERVLCSVIRVYLPNKDLQSRHVIGTEISL